jgi:oxygen-independent coproporphyrinogen III oxidase
MPHPITADELARFDISGPRYTSYPTADRFVEAFTATDYESALRVCSPAPLSLYVHVPFCESVCYYCACNKVVTKHHSKAKRYLQYLERELALVVAQVGQGHAVSQLHFGGGTPTFLNDDELRQCMAMLRAHFNCLPTGEYAIEVDPRTVSAQRLQALWDMGFNRLSFGVQDFDPQVQVAVHRVQPFEQVQALVEQARTIGFGAINVDLIYGLPLQTPHSFATTLTQVQTIKPERIAVYGYAHLPSRFKPQRRIHAAELPSASDKLRMLSLALDMLGDAGYDYIGMDHFALPTDALSVAKRQGRLHRNFQGYSTQPDCDVIALGVSAIGRVGSTYSQNAKTLEAYYDALDSNELPVVRGMRLSREDVVRRAAIMAIMCNGRIEFEDFNTAYVVDFQSYFAKELDSLHELQAAGMVACNTQGLQVTAKGWYVVRVVAMAFDGYLDFARDSERFSRVL